MKFARRRTVETADDAPPTDRPVAAFAGVLDGRRLWVAVDAQPGTIALRDTGSGDVVAPPDDADDDDRPGHLSARLDLTGLPAGEATYDVVVLPPGTGSPLAVWTPPLATHRPLRGAAHQHHLGRAGDGTLRLHRAPAPAAAELTAVSVGGGGVRLSIAGGTGTTVSLVGDDGTTVSTWTGTRSGDDLDVVLTVAGLGGADPQLTQVVVGDALLPVRRRADGLADPGRGAPLPQLDDGDSDRARLRLRWSPHGVLQARIVEADT